MDLAAEIIVERPVQRVFSFYNDRANYTLWASEIVSVEQVSGQPGEIGSVSNQVFKIMGKEENVVVEITNKVDLKEIIKTVKHKVLNIKIAVYFLDMKDKTKIISMFSVTPKNSSLTLMLPSLKTLVKKNQESGLLKFKQLIESH